MSLPGVLAVVAGFGAAAAAAAHWARRNGGQAVEIVAAGAAGTLITLPALTLAATLLGIGPLACLVAGLGTAALVVLATPATGPDLDQAPTPLRDPLTLALVATLLAAAAFAPYGLARDDGVHRMAMTEWEEHLLVANQLMAEDRYPPLNPFLPAAGPASFDGGLHLLAATVTRSSGNASPWPALLAATLLTIAAVPFAAYAAARGLYADPRFAAVAAAAAALLAGFDLLALAADAVAEAIVDGSGNIDLTRLPRLLPPTHLDSWLPRSERQFSTTLLATLQGPQNVLAALAGLLGFHWLSIERRGAGGAVVPGLALGSVPLLSTHVALTLGAGLAVAFILATPARQRRRWLAAAGIALLAALPSGRQIARVVGDLVVAPAAAGDGLNGALFTELLGDGLVARALDTPMLFMIDFGLVGVLAAIAAGHDLRRTVASDHPRRVVIVMIVGLLIAAFLRPAADDPNHLYSHGLLIPWLLACCLAAGEWPRCYGLRWGAALLVCAAGTLYAAGGVVADGFLFGATPYGAVTVARTINEAAAVDAAVAMPEPGMPGHAYWLRRPLVMHDTRRAVRFGASEEEAAQMRRRLDAALADPDPVAAAQALVGLGADIAIVPVGELPATWNRSPCFEQIERGADWVASRIEPACSEP